MRLYASEFKQPDIQIHNPTVNESSFLNSNSNNLTSKSIMQLFMNEVPLNSHSNNLTSKSIIQPFMNEVFWIRIQKPYIKIRNPTIHEWSFLNPNSKNLTSKSIIQLFMNEIFWIRIRNKLTSTSIIQLFMSVVFRIRIQTTLHRNA